VRALGYWQLIVLLKDGDQWTVKLAGEGGAVAWPAARRAGDGVSEMIEACAVVRDRDA